MKVSSIRRIAHSSGLGLGLGLGLMQPTHKIANPMGGHSTLLGHRYISFYVGVTMQRLMSQSPGTGPLDRPDPGLKSED